MNEHKFSAKLARDFRAKGLYVWKINANFAGGIPDMWVSGDAADMWIENKWLHALPKRETTMLVPDLSGQQLDWLIARYLQGVRVIVVLGTEEGVVVFYNPSEWREGITTSEARNRLKPHKEAVNHLCGMVAGTEGQNNEHTTAHPAHAGSRTHRRPAQTSVDTEQRPARIEPNQSRRRARYDAGQLHPVPEQAHRD